MRIEDRLTTRDEVWLNTVDMIKKNLWLGIGISNYHIEYMKYFKTAEQRRFFKFVPHAHNQVLHTTAQLGIIGFILVMILYYLPLKSGTRLIRRMAVFEDKIVIYGILGGVVATYGRSLFEASGMLKAGEFYPDILFWLLIVILLKTDVLYRRQQKDIRLNLDAGGHGKNRA
jgi:O-antigen ligase